MADQNAVDPRIVLPEVSAAAARPEVDGNIGNVRDAKERYASWIALIITWTFTGATALCLVGLFLVLILERKDAAGVKALLEAGIPAFKEICISLTSLFGPLLAFVLGYYFGEKNKGR